MLPTTFQQWHHCMVHECKIELTQAFARQRLAVYEDRQHPETLQFIALYGEQHLQNIINWLSAI
jgi:hypothetical protein